MKNLLYISFFLFSLGVNAQNALYNSGNIQLHGNAELGFHTNFINDSDFTTTSGLVGFYGDNPLQIQGSIAPTLFNAEIFLQSNMLLNTPLNILNNFSFIEGNVLSPLNNQVIFLNFLSDAVFTGENDASKVTGFAAITNKTTFSFPVGSETQLRPLLLESDSNNTLAICAYLPSIPENFNLEQRLNSIGAITDQELWILQTDVPATVTLSWNPQSSLVNIANTIEDIILVGWSKELNFWVTIGNTALSGDLDQGFLISEKFTPSDFDVITFGAVPLPSENFAIVNPTLGNYFVSPNGDGINDFLVIDNIDDVGSNNVQIYNRFGQKVFEMDNYTNEFNGFSNQDNLVLNRSKGLPEGVYYYTISLFDLDLSYQGFLFLDK